MASGRPAITTCFFQVGVIADHELTYEEALRGLNELFGSRDASVPRRRCRKYVLEFGDGETIFRPADGIPALPRSEIELLVDQICDEELGNDIVPQKLAKLFPGSSFEPGRY